MEPAQQASQKLDIANTAHIYQNKTLIHSTTAIIIYAHIPPNPPKIQSNLGESNLSEIRQIL